MLQIFIAVLSQIHSHFNSERPLVSRQIYKQRRSAALAESRTITA
jgi:putative transposase